MRIKVAAILEANSKRHHAIATALKKAGLKVSAARDVEALGKEHLVVLGPSASSPSRLARAVREHAPDALLFATQSRGFKAPYADGVLPLPISPNDLKVRLLEREGRATEGPQRSGSDAILDPLTNFYTFSHFKEVLFVEVKRARRYGFPLALACLGFDPLPNASTTMKAQLMGGLSLAMRRSLRDTDYPVQYSPDRVLLLMPHTDLAGALIVARRVCERVAKATLQVGDETVQPTVSIGVASGEAGREVSFSDLVRHAQEGLAAAMEAGGNRVEFSGASGRVEPPPGIPPVSRPNLWK
jgi:diguanylate cyclase (GGDEF)-like protein